MKIQTFIRIYEILKSIYKKVKKLENTRSFTNDPGDRGSIPGQVIPKTQKMVLDATLLNTQYYKVMINIKVK